MSAVIKSNRFDEFSDNMWKTLYEFTGNVYATAGIMGNLYCESGWNPMNLQNSYEKKLKMTDLDYTMAVDYGTYTSFATDHAGYGLAQWTTKARKQNLYGLSQHLACSICDGVAQTIYLILELMNYSDVLKAIRLSTSVQQASDIILTQYEKPRNITEDKCRIRADYARDVFLHYIGMEVDACDVSAWADFKVLKRGSKGKDVKKLQESLVALGYELPKYGADGSYGKETAAAVKRFQVVHDLYADGIAGAVTQFIIGEKYSQLQQPL